MGKFGNAVRWRRMALGLTQAEVASRIRRCRHPTTQSYIARIENGQIDPRVSTVFSLARALKMRPWQLLVGITESDEFWGIYLELSPQQKRDVQRHMKHMAERR
ncbi:MAG: helix-turn-helix transcriptional regulator [Sphaerochaeta sp.]